MRREQSAAPWSGDAEGVQSSAAIILQEADRMADIVRKIGKITRYETKTYVGAAKILDLDRSSDTHRNPGPTE